jgi:hypothetical protein
MGLRKLEVIEQADYVLGHFGAVLFRIVRLVAFAMPAQIDRDQLVLFSRWVGIESPPHTRIGHPTVEENDGFSFPFGDITELDAVRVEDIVCGFHTTRQCK